jgi:hypothetical protein
MFCAMNIVISITGCLWISVLREATVIPLGEASRILLEGLRKTWQIH